MGIFNSRSSKESPIQHAQTIKLCELCNGQNIKWRCVECKMYLCDKCKAFHLKVPVTAKHQIVTIATPIQDVKRKIVIDNIPCKDHLTRMTCMFCKTCDCLICPECVSTFHAKHQLIPIEHALDEKMEQLKGVQAKYIDSLKLCDSKSIEIQDLIPKYNSTFDESVSKIKLQEQELKEAISQYSMVLQDMVQIERLMVKKTVEKAEQQIEGFRNKLKNLKDELETALTSNQGQNIFQTTPTAPTLKFPRLPNKVVNFIPMKEAKRKIQEMFGTFKKKTVSTVQQELGFEVLKTFTTDLPAINQVIPLNDTSAWLTCITSSKSVITKGTIQDKKIVTSNEMDLEINDVALIYDSNTLLTELNKSDLKLIIHSWKVKSFFSVAPLLPIGIHVSSDKKVIVGAKERGNMYTPSHKSQRAIIVYGLDGKESHRYQYGRDRQRLFTYPKRITTNKNQNILVLDRTSSGTGRVVTLDREGKVRWIYQGHQKINDAGQFNPEGVVTTAEGFTIISDFSSHALHVLSEDGDILTCKVMDTMGIMYPLGLNIDKGGNLWVGCNSGKDTGAKLHIVKLMILI